MKHEWRKHEKSIYLPKDKPEIINVQAFCFFEIEGRGNPESDSFPAYIEALYSLSYAVRMSHKAGIAPDDFFEYTVYPLEGIWDISDEAKKSYSGTVNKDDLVFRLQIRQPDFVTADFADLVMQRTSAKKPHKLLDQVKFVHMQEGLCVQMLHLGTYDCEPESFQIMSEFCSRNNLQRLSKRHREIYLSDVRKVSSDKLKTVLRYQVSPKSL